MFDLITATNQRPLRKRSPVSKILAVVLHVVVAGAILGLSAMQMSDKLPEVPAAIVAFVAAPPAPPPPPPPPAPAPRARSLVEAKPMQTPRSAFAAPIEAPSEIRPEQTTARREDLGGVEGGVEGGVPGGVPGGIVGGLESPALPPPPPPAPVARGPVRIGGQLTAPALLHRVEPVYPDIAAGAQLSGLVILEAVVDTTGCVESVKVLRSRHPLLDRAAVEALRQWQYTPLVLNGTPTRFVLTVTINFSFG